jgi:hypothetical protein
MGMRITDGPLASSGESVNGLRAQQRSSRNRRMGSRVVPTVDEYRAARLSERPQPRNCPTNVANWNKAGSLSL